MQKNLVFDGLDHLLRLAATKKYDDEMEIKRLEEIEAIAKEREKRQQEAAAAAEEEAAKAAAEAKEAKGKK